MDGQWVFDRVYIFFFIGLLFKEAEPIKITSVEIPRIVRAGTDEPIVLDCKYEMEGSSNLALVVKWYVNQELLYQWIHGHKPKGSDEFRQYVDESYRASKDPDMEYRAVKLVRPTHDLSGKVRCSISTQEGEDEAEGEMLVYSPEGSLRISQPIFDEENKKLTVRCFAEDIYPLPTIKIHRDNHLIEKQKQYYNNKKDGRFDVEVIGEISTENMMLPTKFQCEVSIREANYTSLREYLYNGVDEHRLSLLISSIASLIVVRALILSY